MPLLLKRCMLQPYTVQEGGSPSHGPLPDQIQPSTRYLAQGPDLARLWRQHSFWDWPCFWECLSGSLSLFIFASSLSIFLCVSLFISLFPPVLLCLLLFFSVYLGVSLSLHLPLSRLPALCLCPGSPDLSGFLCLGTQVTGSGFRAGPLLQGPDSTNSGGLVWGALRGSHPARFVRLSDEPLSLGLFKSWHLSRSFQYPQHENSARHTMGAQQTFVEQMHALFILISVSVFILDSVFLRLSFAESL